MKKTILILVMLSMALVPLMANDNDVRQDRDIATLQAPVGLKLGLLLGYPSGVTAGYRFSNWFEGNLTVGYNFSFSKSAIISANTLFTLVNIPIGDAGVMPLSLGPQLNFILGSNFYMELVADLRLEYTFPNIPLNLFGEFGFGFRFFDDGGWTAFNGGIGVRYVF